MIAACLQRKVSIPWGMFNIYPNLYIVLVGPSGCRKGTAMGPGLKMLNDLGIKMAAEATTRESLIRELRKTSNTSILADGTTVFLHSSLTIFSQELTVFLGYNNMQLMADLCDWFDCRERWTYRTKTMGEDDIVGVWVNLIGATTPDLLQSTLPRDAIGGGLTARMIMVFASGKGKTVVCPFETSMERKLRANLIADLEQISMISGEYKVTDQFMEDWAIWYTAQDANPPFTDSRLAGYMERRPLHILKLSMVMAASESNNLIITERHLARAVHILTSIEAGMGRTFSGIGKSKTSDVLTRVLGYIATMQTVTMSDIMNQFYFDADLRDMNSVIETLRSMGAISIGTVGTKQIIKYTGKEIQT